MAAYTLVRFTSPNAGVQVNQAVTDQYGPAAYGQALKNLDVNALGIAIANILTSGGSIDMSLASDTAGLKLPSKAGAAPTADGAIAVNTTTHVVNVGSNGSTATLLDTLNAQHAPALDITLTDESAPSAPGSGKTIVYSVSGVPHFRAGASGSDTAVQPAITILGPTFASSTTTMTNANQDYTAVTLGSALVNGKSYKISGQVQVLASASDVVDAEIWDSTNSVSLANATWNNNISNGRVTFGFPPVTYSGFSGTPTIIIRVRASQAGDVIQSASAQHTASKTTYLTAEQYT